MAPSRENPREGAPILVADAAADARPTLVDMQQPEEPPAPPAVVAAQPRPATPRGPPAEESTEIVSEIRRAPLLPSLLAHAQSVDIETPWFQANSSPSESVAQLVAALEADGSPRSSAGSSPRHSPKAAARFGKAPDGHGEQASPRQLDSAVQHQRVYKGDLERARRKSTSDV